MRNFSFLLVAAVVVTVVLAVVLFSTATYVVREGKQAVVTQFGEPVNFATTPGLHWKVPFIHEVHLFEQRLLPWDGEPENMQTRDKKRIFVDVWARWRIVDLKTFYKAVRDEQQGHKFLDDLVDSSVRDVVARHNLIDVVRSSNDELIYEDDEVARDLNRDEVTTGRTTLEKQILAAAGADLRERYGMELTTVHFKRVMYSERVRDTVFERMQTERQRIARLFESEAEEEKNRIQGTTRKELDEIEGEMSRQSAKIRGEADAQVIQMTAEAYGKNPEFYRFLQRLELFKDAFKRDTRLVLTTDSEILKLFKGMDTLPPSSPPASAAPNLTSEPAEEARGEATATAETEAP